MGGEHGRDLAQARVAGEVAVDVVDLLEAVEVADAEHDVARPRLVEALVEGAAVAQLRGRGPPGEGPPAPGPGPGHPGTAARDTREEGRAPPAPGAAASHGAL